MNCRMIVVGAVLAVAGLLANAAIAEAPAIRVQDAQALLIQNVTVASPMAGILRALPIEAGDTVAAGQRLARLDTRAAEAELIAAEASLAVAMIQAETDIHTRYARRTLDVHQREYEQSRQANQIYEGSVTDAELDRLNLVVDQAALSIEQAEQERRSAQAVVNEKRAAVQLATTRLSQHTVDAPVVGRVAEIFTKVGQWVQVGEPVARLTSRDPIRISGFVDGHRLRGSLAGYPATFQWQQPETDEVLSRRGTVTFVSDEFNPITGEVMVWARLKNADGQIQPGMRGTLIIEGADEHR